MLELVEGPTLADRIAQGPVSLDEALPIARQMAEALEAAHEQGVVHRDLKPANVKITPDEKVKVLDFGLAKAMETAPAAASLTQSPTLSMAATQAGVILGTAAYMSPEQAKGFTADQRSDVFSFGVVLYEMLTGRQPFQGETVAEVLGAVLVGQPDLNSLAPNLNPRLPELLRRCLEKNPKRRWQAVGDLRVELEVIAAAPRAVAAPAPLVAQPQPLWKRATPIAVIAAMVASALTGIGVWNFRNSTTALTITRFPLTLAEGQQFTNPGRQVVALSPDGMQMVYVANQRLYLRSMSELEAQPIPGTEITQGVLNPVFSPDGRSIAFWTGADRTVKRIAVSGALGNTGTAQFSVSDTGSLMYVPGPALTSTAQSDLALIDRKGAVEPLKLPSGPYQFPRVSPDGKRLAFATDDGKEAIVWIYDLAGASSMRRLTFGGKNRFPAWFADGERVAFQSDREGDLGIFWQPADPTGTAERLTKPDQGTSHVPDSWSPKGERFP